MAITDIVFDFYGTLVGFQEESVREGEKRAHEYLVSRNYPIEYAKFRTHMNSSYLELHKEAQAGHKEFCLRDIAKRFMKNSFGVEVDEDFARQFGRVHVDEWNEGTVFWEGVAEFIDRLSESYRLSIISNTHCAEIVHKNLTQMGVQHRFDQVVTSIELGIRKPHRQIFDHTLKKLKVDASQAVYVGDTYEDDFLGAKSAGMKAFLVDKKKKRLDLKDERLNHIFELETKLNLN